MDKQFVWRDGRPEVVPPAPPRKPPTLTAAPGGDGDEHEPEANARSYGYTLPPGVGRVVEGATSLTTVKVRIGTSGTFEHQTAAATFIKYRCRQCQEAQNPPRRFTPMKVGPELAVVSCPKCGTLNAMNGVWEPPSGPEALLLWLWRGLWEWIV